jgi:CHAD domain
LLISAIATAVPWILEPPGVCGGSAKLTPEGFVCHPMVMSPLTESTIARREPMAYRLKEIEDVGVGLRRILLEELAEARSSPGDDLNRDPSEAIHDARKRFKKCRAVLRLAHSDIDRKEYKALNRSFRDAGRILSPVRDADVLVATVESLIEDKRRLVATRTTLGERRDTVRVQILGGRQVCERGPRQSG